MRAPCELQPREGARRPARLYRALRPSFGADGALRRRDCVGRAIMSRPPCGPAAALETFLIDSKRND